MKIKSRFLKRMILNKVLMAVIPVLLLACFFGESFYSMNTERIEELQGRVLQENVKAFEDRYYDLQVMVTRMEKDPSILEAHFASNQISYPILDFMQKTMLPRTFYSEFLYIPQTNDYVYTASYTANAKSDFILESNQSFFFSETGNSAVLEYAKSGKETVLPEQIIRINGREYLGITLMLPLTRGASGALVAVIPSEVIKSMFGGSDRGRYGTMLYHGDKEILSDGEYSDKLNAVFIPYGSIWRQKKGDIFYFGAQTYFSELTVIRFYSASTWQNMNVRWVILGVMLFLCVAWVIAFIFISVETEYKPIKNISTNLKNLLGDSGVDIPVPAQRSEIDAVNIMIEILRDLRKDPAYAEGEEKVLGNRNLYDYLNQMTEVFSFGEARSYFSTLLIIAPALTAGGEEETAKELIRLAQDVDAEFAVWRDRIVVAVAYDKNKEMNGFISELSERLSAHYGENGYNLVIGTVGSRTEDLRKSFFDAEVAGNFMTSRSMSGALYSDFVFGDSALRNKQVIELLSRLDYQFKLRSTEGLDKALGDIEDFISDPDTPPDYCRAVFLFVKNNFLSEFHYSAVRTDDNMVNKLLNVEIQDVGVMLMMVKLIRSNLEKIFPARVNEGSVFEKEKVSVYIDEHFLDVDFSLNSVAERFGSSDSGFSRMFKSVFGVNFKMYVDAKKMWEAKRLLRETSLTIEEISARINYSNASNFLRAFKGQFLMSPGQYRKSCEKDGVVQDD